MDKRKTAIKNYVGYGGDISTLLYFFALQFFCQMRTCEWEINEFFRERNLFVFITIY